MIEPMPGRALVELHGAYRNIAATTKAYESKTSGVVVAVNNYSEMHDNYDPIYDTLKGKKIYWQEYREGSKIQINDKDYALIKLEDIDGSE